MWAIFQTIQNNICYMTLKEKYGLGEPSPYICKRENEFGVCIGNENGGLHFICLSLEGRITYMHFDGNMWSEQGLGEYNIKEYDIRYPAILVLDNKIHIIFALGNPWETEIWTLYQLLLGWTELGT